MDERYDKIRSDYRRIKNSEDYSPAFKEKKREAALAAIDALKAEYYTDAMLWTRQDIPMETEAEDREAYLQQRSNLVGTGAQQGTDRVGQAACDRASGEIT